VHCRRFLHLAPIWSTAGTAAVIFAEALTVEKCEGCTDLHDCLRKCTRSTHTTNGVWLSQHALEGLLHPSNSASSAGRSRPSFSWCNAPPGRVVEHKHEKDVILPLLKVCVCVRKEAQHGCWSCCVWSPVLCYQTWCAAICTPSACQTLPPVTLSVSVKDISTEWQVDLQSQVIEMMLTKRSFKLHADTDHTNLTKNHWLTTRQLIKLMAIQQLGASQWICFRLPNVKSHMSKTTTLWIASTKAQLQKINQKANMKTWQCQTIKKMQLSHSTICLAFLTICILWWLQWQTANWQWEPIWWLFHLCFFVFLNLTRMLVGVKLREELLIPQCARLAMCWTRPHFLSSL